VGRAFESRRGREQGFPNERGKLWILETSSGDRAPALSVALAVFDEVAVIDPGVLVACHICQAFASDFLSLP
jgi:hypothetical protein